MTFEVAKETLKTIALHHLFFENLTLLSFPQRTYFLFKRASSKDSFVYKSPTPFTREGPIECRKASKPKPPLFDMHF